MCRPTRGSCTSAGHAARSTYFPFLAFPPFFPSPRLAGVFCLVCLADAPLLFPTTQRHCVMDVRTARRCLPASLSVQESACPSVYLPACLSGPSRSVRRLEAERPANAGKGLAALGCMLCGFVSRGQTAPAAQSAGRRFTQAHGTYRSPASRCFRALVDPTMATAAAALCPRGRRTECSSATMPAALACWTAPPAPGRSRPACWSGRRMQGARVHISGTNRIQLSYWDSE
jgi:hypothetical protein